MNKRQILLNQLENHGKKNLSSLNEEELLDIFNEINKEWVLNFVAYNSGIRNIKAINIDEMEQEIKLEILNSNNLYDTFYQLLQKHTFNSIYDVVLNSMNSKIVEKTLFILEIKYRQYQEILLEEIAKRMELMPAEEAAGFINFVEQKREDIEFLKDILLELKDSKIGTNINKITNIKKYIISNFMTEYLENAYKDFFAHSDDKQELIDRLRNISNAYSKKQLDDMTKEDLVDILASIKQKEIDEKKDKEDYDKYLALFKKALYEDDTFGFNTIVMQALEDISQDCLKNLKNTLKNEDPLFESKFQSAQQEWQKFK
ncbi:hypothetical protein [Helicobacter sp. MIT 99-5507]|uniref:hypothetical protein n=1 Tax=Helicobacter sp. MIT 99-5507 TaxID=152489 RepID=UPI000E1EA893|nr:hypothetical protein [Helicobacter sp. MIT 99-5507]RDU57844.1 hypothetical protein CQA42_02775 [Helicobacter sp. MIT 99-5507]